MRLMHTETINIVAKLMKDEEFTNSTVSRKQFLSHCWSEVLKYLATRQEHPKMWLSDFELGLYMKQIMLFNQFVECNLNEQHLIKYDEVWYGYLRPYTEDNIKKVLSDSFDSNYLFSDAVSLYFKGLNIFPYIFGDDWRKYVPIENLSEIHRVVGKAMDKKSKRR
jgi:hypothetical protein